MTPAEALAKALHHALGLFTFGGKVCGPDNSLWSGMSADVNRALDALGFTVARTEHAADGEALARLREVMPKGWGYAVGRSARGTETWLDVYKDTGYLVVERHGPTIAAAADACREAIEATR